MEVQTKDDALNYLDRAPTEEELAGHDRRTADHIEKVRSRLKRIIRAFLACFETEREYMRNSQANILSESLRLRAERHDRSKTEPPERPIFARIDARLQDLTYGSDEYEDALDDLGPALRHHYEHNPHHPEHFEDGIRSMNLLDVAEMTADWSAAIERHSDGHPLDSMKKNRSRFDIPDALSLVLTTTLFWLQGDRPEREVMKRLTVPGMLWDWCLAQDHRARTVSRYYRKGPAIRTLWENTDPLTSD